MYLQSTIPVYSILGQRRKERSRKEPNVIWLTEPMLVIDRCYNRRNLAVATSIGQGIVNIDYRRPYEPPRARYGIYAYVS